MAVLRKPSLFKYFAIALAIVLLLSTVPSMLQTRINVTTDRDVIKNVSVETPRVPLIISLFPSPSIGIGAYNITVEVLENGMPLFYSELHNVPSGDFTFVWINNGVPKSGTYYVIVRLLRASVEVDAYSLNVEF